MFNTFFIAPLFIYFFLAGTLYPMQQPNNFEVALDINDENILDELISTVHTQFCPGQDSQKIIHRTNKILTPFINHLDHDDSVEFSHFLTFLDDSIQQKIQKIHLPEERNAFARTLIETLNIIYSRRSSTVSLDEDSYKERARSIARDKASLLGFLVFISIIINELTYMSASYFLPATSPAWPHLYYALVAISCINIVLAFSAIAYSSCPNNGAHHGKPGLLTRCIYRCAYQCITPAMHKNDEKKLIVLKEYLQSTNLKFD